VPPPPGLVQLVETSFAIAMLRYDFEVEDFAKQIRTAVEPACDPDTVGKLLDYLRADTIGCDHAIKTPFGVRRVVYTDFTASGRSLGLVEKFIQEEVLPSYGNTHTLSSGTARQTTFYRNEARQVAKHYLNATHEDALIFCGAGTTGAISKFVEMICSSNFAVLDDSDAAADAADITDCHFREDRWGSCECTLCGIRVKTEAVYRAHRYSEMHQARLQEKQQEGERKRDAFEGVRRIVIFCDPTAHHSSMLPFRELTRRYVHATTEPIFLDSHFTTGGVADPAKIEVEVCTLRLNPSTYTFDEEELAQKLAEVRQRKGAGALCMLSAGSNVTGVLADVPRLTSLIHQHGGLACWDYAATAGHIRPDLNPPTWPDAAVDAAFFSPHKLLGGPGAVGLLMAKKRLLRNAVPVIQGGGVVFFVDPKAHSYIQNAEDREEAGTPDIIGCVRTGLVYHLHTLLPSAAVSLEEQGLRCLLQRWSAHPGIELLGPGPESTRPRTAIVSFMIRYGNQAAGGGLYLHYNFVVALLNDLFGLQTRGGCACAGPYGQMLLGIDEQLASEFDHCLARSAQEVLRPGFVRVGVHFTLSSEDLELLASSVEWVAEHGWELLPAYTFCVESGEWHHRLATPQQDRKWLSALVPPVLQSSPLRELEASLIVKGDALPTDLFATANTALTAAFRGESAIPLASTRCPLLSADFANMLWFALPTDASSSLLSGSSQPRLATDAVVFSATAAEEGGLNIERPESSVFTVRQQRVANKTDIEASSTTVPTSEESSEKNFGRSASGDATWEASLGEWGCDAEDAVDLTSVQKKALSFPATAISPKVPKTLRSSVAGAIKEYDMIREGDRLLVGLSGGKDSLTMLHVLLELQKKSPVRFTVAAATVNPETPEYSPQPLIDYMEALGVPYYFLSKPLIQMAKDHLDPKKPSICSFCARMKRGLLYTCMRENNFNVLCLGQHLDDFAESFLMSSFRNGALRTMKSNYYVEAEDLRVCRPLAHVREKVAAQFAKDNRLPIIADNCPACFAAPKERHRVKLMLSQQEFEHPDLFWSLLSSMKPLMSITHTSKAQDLCDEEFRGGGGVGGKTKSSSKPTKGDDDVLLGASSSSRGTGRNSPSEPACRGAVARPSQDLDRSLSWPSCLVSVAKASGMNAGSLALAWGAALCLVSFWAGRGTRGALR